MPLEFQSTVDERMAGRMLEQAAMLRNDLDRVGELSGPDGGPPPLLPVVVYNGVKRWTAPLGLGAEGELDLAESFGLWIEDVLEPRLGVGLPSLMDMMEEPSMLGETLDAWAEEKFQLGWVEGRIEGERELLFRQAKRRFGSETADALSGLINGLDDLDGLAKVGDLVVDCATGRELLNRAGRIPAPAKPPKRS